MRAAGLRFSAFSDDGLVEIIELPGHPWFVAVQFHPESILTGEGMNILNNFLKRLRG